MSKFRKKPVVIEAHQFGGTVSSADAIIAWAGMEPRPNESDPVTLTVADNEGTFRDRIERPQQFGPLVIHTLEGDMTAQEGDWIIKGVKGEFYPCKPDIFAATYEPVGPVSPVRDPKCQCDPEHGDICTCAEVPVRDPALPELIRNPNIRTRDDVIREGLAACDDVAADGMERDDAIRLGIGVALALWDDVRGVRDPSPPEPSE